MSVDFPLIKNVLTPIAKSVLVRLGLPAAAWGTNTVIPNKIFGWRTTALIISNKEMNDTMKLVKSLEESGLLIKGVSEILKNKAKKTKTKKQRYVFLRILLGTLLNKYDDMKVEIKS